jgi:hypothetical protein
MWAKACTVLFRSASEKIERAYTQKVKLAPVGRLHRGRQGLAPRHKNVSITSRHLQKKAQKMECFLDNFEESEIAISR